MYPPVTIGVAALCGLLMLLLAARLRGFARLPFDEPYRIPASTAKSIQMAWAVGGRVIAVGTTVVRALEHSAFVHGSVRASTGIAVNKIGLGTSLRVVDAVLSGTHEPGTSHYNLLAAFVDEQILGKMDDVLQHDGYRTHEFGDSVFIEKTRVKCHLSGGKHTCIEKNIEIIPLDLVTHDDPQKPLEQAF